MVGDNATSMGKLVRENNLGWKPGDAFDMSLLDQLDSLLYLPITDIGKFGYLS